MNPRFTPPAVSMEKALRGPRTDFADATFAVASDSGTAWLRAGVAVVHVGALHCPDDLAEHAAASGRENGG